jgi:multisubunit Na+/H+ antiporter MnhC subunit
MILTLPQAIVISAIWISVAIASRWLGFFTIIIAFFACAATHAVTGRKF